MAWSSVSKYRPTTDLWPIDREIDGERERERERERGEIQKYGLIKIQMLPAGLDLKPLKTTQT
jgi:hypothetical protein